MDLKGKTALVTGAAGGIGRATAVMLARAGAVKVGIADVDESGMAETLRLIEAEGAKGGAHLVDVSDAAALHAWLTGAQTNGGYDILYNNAGVVSGEPQFPFAGAAKNKWIVDVNLTAPIIATEIAVHHLKERGGGVIVNTVSTVALGNGFSDALYASTKSGLMMFTRCCASLKESSNVRVMGVLPGLTDTPILYKTGANGKAAEWMGPILSGYAKCAPEDIAEAVINLIVNDSLPGGSWVAVRNVDGKIEYEWGPKND